MSDGEHYWTCPDCGGHYFGRPTTKDGIDYSRIRCHGTDANYCGKIFPDPKYKGEQGETVKRVF